MASGKELIELMKHDKSFDQALTLGILQKYIAYGELYLNTMSLNIPEWKDNDSEIMQSIPDDGASAEDLATEYFLREALGEALNTLTRRERAIITYRFGLNGFYSMTLDEVGKVFDLTRERIRQIELKALRKLSHPSRARKIKDYWRDL